MKNEGTADIIIRAVVGFALLLLAYYTLEGFWMWFVYFFSAVALLTAATGFCPLYQLFGISSIRKKSKKK